MELPLTRFLTSSAPAPVCFKQQTDKWTDFYRASSYDSSILAVVILYVCLQKLPLLMGWVAIMISSDYSSFVSPPILFAFSYAAITSARV